MRSRNDIARSPAQVPPRPNFIPSQIKDPVEKLRRALACREYDQKYFPSRAHAIELENARYRLCNADPAAYETEILRYVDSFVVPPFKWPTMADAGLGRWHAFDKFCAKRKAYLQTQALQGATTLFEIMEAWREFLVAEKINNGANQQLAERVRDFHRRKRERERGVVRHFPRRGVRSA